MTKTNRDSVMAVALELFARKGFHATTIGEIEAAAGLTPRAGGFYRHFESKEAVLVEGVRDAASRLVGELKLDDILARARGIRAELMLIADHLLSHAAEYRTLRLVLQREAPALPALRSAMQAANLRLADRDIVPWTAHALKRAGRPEKAETFAFLVFGPVLLYVISLDRDQPAFGLSQKAALDAWADHWSGVLAPRAKAPPAKRRSGQTRRAV